MSDPAQVLKDLQPTKAFFVGIDSDGCVFDTMGIKHRECFCPMLIAYFDLQPVAQAARQCKDFADLFSKTRGANRHKTAVRIIRDLLPGHPMVKQRGFEVPQYPHYFQWVDDPHSLLSNDGLKTAIDKARGQARAELERALTWSLRVNDLVAEIVKGMPPFPYAEDCLKEIATVADVIVCSSTPYEALVREWQEHGIAQYARVITGQEMGTKAGHLAYASKGNYKHDHMLMIGDAPGDRKAAQAVNALFYPINPGQEIQSWKRLRDEAWGRFINLDYDGDYQAALIEEFEGYLPEHPPWYV